MKTIFLILLIGVALTACATYQKTPLPSDIPRYHEIRDTGNNVTNLKECIDYFNNYADEYNKNHFGQHLSFNAPYYLVCQNDTCLCS
jgi:hypothetical protein